MQLDKYPYFFTHHLHIIVEGSDGLPSTIV